MIKKYNSKTMRLLYLGEFEIKDVVRNCHSVVLFDGSKWVNLVTGYFINVFTLETKDIARLYPSIRFGYDLKDNLVCRRKGYKPNKLSEDGEALDGWTLRQVKVVPKNKKN